MSILALNPKECATLEKFTMQTKDAKLLRRVLALLWIAHGEDVQVVAERLSVTQQSIYNWIKRFKDRSNQKIHARLADGQRSGRPKTAKGIIDPLIRQIYHCDPRDFGYDATVWTAPLFKQYLKEVHGIHVSRRSVSLAIARLGLNWQRSKRNVYRPFERWYPTKMVENLMQQGV